MSLEIAWEDFLTPGVFEAVRAPAKIMADQEGRGQEVEIILRRQRTAPIELRQTPESQK
jgi:hypothetical protein